MVTPFLVTSYKSSHMEDFVETASPSITVTWANSPVAILSRRAEASRHLPFQDSLESLSSIRPVFLSISKRHRRCSVFSPKRRDNAPRDCLLAHCLIRRGRVLAHRARYIRHWPASKDPPYTARNRRVFVSENAGKSITKTGSLQKH